MRVRTNNREFDPAALREKYRNLDDQIIADLADFCLAHKSAFAETDRLTAYNCGRQAVWLHINEYLSLSRGQIERLYAGRGVELMEEGPDA